MADLRLVYGIAVLGSLMISCFNGMNIVRLELFDKDGNLSQTLRKPFAVPYRSTLIRLFTRLLLLPLHVFRFVDETMHLPIELASSYGNIERTPVVRGQVTLESRELLWSHATIRFNAKLGGPAHWFYYWPYLSFFIITLCSFVSMNCFCILIGCYQVLTRQKPRVQPPTVLVRHPNRIEVFDESSSTQASLESKREEKLIVQPLEATNIPSCTPQGDVEQTNDDA